jgi:hypothetical protein
MPPHTKAVPVEIPTEANAEVNTTTTPNTAAPPMNDDGLDIPPTLKRSNSGPTTPPTPNPAAAVTTTTLASSPTSSPTTTSPVLDEFDIENLRLPQNFIETAGVKKLLTTVHVRRPHPHDFNRVHPSPEFRANLAIIKVRDERDEIYLLTPSMAAALPGEFTMATVFTAINRQGNVFLWPVPLPQTDGRMNEWHRSAAEAAEMMMTKWIRLKANMSNGAYDIYEAQGVIAGPAWPPDLKYQELLRIGYRDKLVNMLDHPLVKKLHGLA